MWIDICTFKNIIFYRIWNYFCRNAPYNISREKWPSFVGNKRFFLVLTLFFCYYLRNVVIHWGDRRRLQKKYPNKSYNPEKLPKFIYHQVVYMPSQLLFFSTSVFSFYKRRIALGYPVVLRQTAVWYHFENARRYHVKEDQSWSTVLRFRNLFSSPSSFFNSLQPLCKRLPITNLARRLLIADEFYWSVMYVRKNWNLLLVGK